MNIWRWQLDLRSTGAARGTWLVMKEKEIGRLDETTLFLRGLRHSGVVLSPSVQERDRVFLSRWLFLQLVNWGAG